MKTKRIYHNFEDHKKKLFKDPKVREACEKEFLTLMIAHQIVDLRKKKKLKQKELAVKIGISGEQYMSALESGRRMTSIPLLLKMAGVFGKRLSIKFI